MAVQVFGDQMATAMLDGRSWPQPYLKVAICMTCNGYLGKNLEEPAKKVLPALIDGQPTAVSPEDQHLVTRYTTKTVLLMSLWPHMESGRDPYLTSRDFHRFRDGLVVRPGTRVWVGAVEDADPVREAEITLALPEIRDNPHFPWLMPVRSSCHFLQVGHLVIVLFLNRPVAPVSVDLGLKDARVMIHSAQRAGLVRKIWPATEDGVQWPPPLSFDTTTYGQWWRHFAYVPPEITIRTRTPGQQP